MTKFKLRTYIYFYYYKYCFKKKKKKKLIHEETWSGYSEMPKLRFFSIGAVSFEWMVIQRRWVGYEWNIPISVGFLFPNIKKLDKRIRYSKKFYTIQPYKSLEVLEEEELAKEEIKRLKKKQKQKIKSRLRTKVKKFNWDFLYWKDKNHSFKIKLIIFKKLYHWTKYAKNLALKNLKKRIKSQKDIKKINWYYWIQRLKEQKYNLKIKKFKKKSLKKKNQKLLIENLKSYKINNILLKWRWRYILIKLKWVRLKKKKLVFNKWKNFIVTGMFILKKKFFKIPKLQIGLILKIKKLVKKYDKLVQKMLKKNSVKKFRKKIKNNIVRYANYNLKKKKIVYKIKNKNYQIWKEINRQYIYKKRNVLRLYFFKRIYKIEKIFLNSAKKNKNLNKKNLANLIWKFLKTKKKLLKTTRNTVARLIKKKINNKKKKLITKKKIKRKQKKAYHFYMGLVSKLKNIKFKIKYTKGKIPLVAVKKNIVRFLGRKVRGERLMDSRKKLYYEVQDNLEELNEPQFLTDKNWEGLKLNWWRKKTRNIFPLIYSEDDQEPNLETGAKIVRFLGIIVGEDRWGRVFRFRNIIKANMLIGWAAKLILDTFWFFQRPVLLFFYTTMVIAKLLNSAVILNIGLHILFSNIYLHTIVLRNFIIWWATFFEDKSGVRLVASGKWFGRMRAKKKFMWHRTAKRQSISHYVDYHNTNVITKYGIFSLKTWIGNIW